MSSYPSARPAVRRGWRIGALGAALLCGTMLGAVGAPHPAAAQARVEAPPTVELIQLTGKWETSVGPMEILGGGPGRPNNRSLITGKVTNPKGQEITFGIWATGGKLKGQGFENNWDGLKVFDATVLPDGTLEFRFVDEPYEGRKVIAGQRVGEPRHAASPFLGRWTTTLGDLELRAEGDHVTGTLVSPAGSRIARRIVALHAFDHSRPITGLNGAWRSATSDARGAMRIDLTGDGQRLLGSYSTVNGEAETEAAWSGTRVAAGQPPQPTEPGPGTPGQPTTPPGPGQTPTGSGPTPPAEAPPSAFKALRRLEVRLDRAQVAHGYPTHQVHVFLTVKNVSASPQYFTSGFIKVFLAEAGGSGQERSQPYMALGEPAALFSSTPVIRPGGELKVRYVFNPAPQAQFEGVTVTEGDKEVSFPAQVAP